MKKFLVFFSLPASFSLPKAKGIPALLFSFFILCLMAGVLFYSVPALAQTTLPSLLGSGPCSNSIANPTGTGSNCDSCISSPLYQNYNSGGQIIGVVFASINNVLSNVEYIMFNGIVSGPIPGLTLNIPLVGNGFQGAIAIALILYVAMYGVLIMLGIGSYRLNEVAIRLIKVAFVYMLTSPTAWNDFQTWVQSPVIHGMNQLIMEFTTLAESNATASTSTNIPTTIISNLPLGSIPLPNPFSNVNVGLLPPAAYDCALSTGVTAISGGGLDCTPFATMFGSTMTAVFSPQMGVAIVSMAVRGSFFGWCISFFLLWALIEFFLMMMGALITYAKAIIGLAFLFGVAPLFFIFLLFDRTRNIFNGWMVHVITFAFQPVMLFAFLSFYAVLIQDAAPYLLTDTAGSITDFCWTKWLSVPGTVWEHFSWGPTSHGAVFSGPWIDANKNVKDSPINVPNLVYFLMLCHLGRAFCNYIEVLSGDIAQGIGPGVVKGSDLGDMIKRGVGKTWQAVKK